MLSVVEVAQFVLTFMATTIITETALRSELRPLIEAKTIYV
jgi:hypothetical protein